jgi:hypothetical protein
MVTEMTKYDVAPFTEGGAWHWKLNKQIEQAEPHTYAGETVATCCTELEPPGNPRCPGFTSREEAERNANIHERRLNRGRA